MKRIIPSFLAVLFLLSACTASPSEPLTLPSISPSPAGTPSAAPENSGEPESEVEQTPVEALPWPSILQLKGTWTGQLTGTNPIDEADLTLDIITEGNRSVLISSEQRDIDQNPLYVSEMRDSFILCGDFDEDRLTITLKLVDLRIGALIRRIYGCLHIALDLGNDTNLTPVFTATPICGR